jgi:hypothetical protein
VNAKDLEIEARRFGVRGDVTLAFLGMTLICVLSAVAAPPAGIKLVPESPGYTYRKVALLGDPVPGGGQMVNDFEVALINQRGQITFGTDLSAGGEGVFLGDENGSLKLLARTGDPAPGGGTYGGGFLSIIALNDLGDVAFTFMLDGPNPLEAGLYLYSHETGELSGVMLPGQPVPGGGTFIGCNNHVALNNRGDIVFTAYVDGGFPNDVPPGNGVGTALFVRCAEGRVLSILRPGDSGPGGKYDFFINPWINDAGVIGFGAHLAGDFCLPQGSVLCAESMFLWKPIGSLCPGGAAGESISIARIGDPAPCGGRYRIAFGAFVNNRDELAFTGDLTDDPDPKVAGRALGVFLSSASRVIPVGCPGDSMPGGGNFVTGSFQKGGHDLNELGEVTFNATLDTTHLRKHDGKNVPEQGLYLWSKGNLRLAARTGTMIGGLGRLLAFLQPGLYLNSFPDSYIWPVPGTAINERGQILTTAAVEDPKDDVLGALLIATPVEPYYFLGHQQTRDGVFEVALSSSPDTTAFSFALALDGECASARIESVDPGADLPERPETWQVNLLNGGSAATVEARLPAGSLLSPAENLRVAIVRLAGKVDPGAKCRISFAEAGSPAVVPAITTTAAETKAAACGGSLEVAAIGPPAPTFRRGDADANSRLELTDPVRLLGYAFLGDPKPECLDAADVDDSGETDISDAIYSLSYQFLGGPPPLPPGPFDCGPDPSPESPDLGCDRSCG